MSLINGVPLDNPGLGWSVQSDSELRGSWSRDRVGVRRAGRDGFVSGLPSTSDALVALFGDVAVWESGGREVAVEVQGVKVSALPTATPMDRVTVDVMTAGPFLRSKAEVTVSAALSSASVPVSVFGSSVRPGAAPIATNLFTGPSFEAALPAVEVYRNLNTNPRLRGISTGWSAGPEVVFTQTPDGLQLDRAVAGGSRANLLYHSANQPVVTGDERSSSIEVSVPAGFPAVTVYLYTHGYGVETPVGESPEVTINPGQTVTLRAPGSTPIPAGVTGVRSLLRAGAAAGAVPAGARIVVRDAGLYPLRVPPPYFDGTASPDADLTASWTGTANASASILSGLPVGGWITPFNAVAIRSTRWKKDGNYSARIIPTTTSTNSGFSVGGGNLPKHATHIVTTYLEQPLLNPASNAGMVSRYSPTLGDQRPNVPGEHEHRFTSPATITGGTLDIRAGCKQGDGEMWVDLLTVVAGDYTGPAFSGSTEDAPERVYDWTGQVDGSTSTVFARSDILSGLSAPVQDAVIRVKGAATGIQVTDQSGAWVTLPDVAAGRWVRFEADTGRAFETTTDTWTGGTEVSGAVDFGGPRGVFEITPALTPGDPTTRVGRLTVATASRTGAVIEVRGKSAHLL